MITETQLARAVIEAENRVDHIDYEYVDDETELEFHGTLNLTSIVAALNNTPAPVVAPLTLDDVARHTDAIVTEFAARQKQHEEWYTAAVSSLTAAIEASPDLDHAAAGHVFLSKLQEMVKGAGV